VKDFALDDRGQIRPPGHEARMTGRIGGLLTVNGQVNPQFTIAPGGLLRLRLLNASSSRFFNLSLEDHPLYLIATDGAALMHRLNYWKSPWHRGNGRKCW
jgi:FtsP/CotA-like multicopper oxidase with cupredoxin domain